MPKSDKAKYHHCRQEDPKKFNKKNMKTVPLSHTPEGKSGKIPLKRDGKDLKAVVGRLIDSNKWQTQSILIPKKKGEKVNWIPNPRKDKKGEPIVDDYCMIYS